MRSSQLFISVLMLSILLGWIGWGITQPLAPWEGRCTFASTICR